MICGGPVMLDAPRLSYLGECLRSLLAVEARGLEVEGAEPLDAPKAASEALPAGCAARRLRARTASGAAVRLVLAAREGVLADGRAVAYAVRQALVTDALTLQVRPAVWGLEAGAEWTLCGLCSCQPGLAGTAA
jgi:hypothetical protein